MNLHQYRIVVVNSSGGKDSIVAMKRMVEMAQEQGYPLDKIVVSHQDLGKVEWAGSRELVQEQADVYGLKVYYSKRRDKHGDNVDLLEHVRQRGMWPGNNSRYCTSDHKRGPGNRVLTMLSRDWTDQGMMLQVFGFRAQESTARAKKQVLTPNQRASSKKRLVFDYCPILDMTEDEVWSEIHEAGLPYPRAYDLGMPRYSCMFCVFAPEAALVIAGRENPDLLQEYVDVEEEIGHTFRKELSLKEVQQKCQDPEYSTKAKYVIMGNVRTVDLYGVQVTPIEDMRYSKYIANNPQLPGANTLTKDERKARVIEWLKEHRNG